MIKINNFKLFNCIPFIMNCLYDTASQVMFTVATKDVLLFFVHNWRR